MLLLTCVEGEAFQTPAFGLPSWVPDWSVQGFVGLRLTGYRHFHAAVERSPAYSISRDKRVLDVEAVKLDNIVETSDKKQDLRAHLHSSTFWHLVSRLPSTNKTTHGVQSREEVVWRTLMTNRGSIRADCKAQYPAPDDIKHSFRDWILWRYATAPEEPSTFPMPSSNRSVIPTQDELEDSRRRAANDPPYLIALARGASLFDLHYSHAMLQRPFRSRQGYFGIGTQCLREGDSVWLVSGCRVPIILRPLDGSKHYQLVGASYLHGFMDGEALGQGDVQFEMVSLE
ncbi:hypothetical protein EKO04_001316 [Ascochyta lentis]|uniref:Uncharacterized protein n=1 Tax=Ascochyta lentis TaxID=205686 RepID=A0A8H7MM24_9PLEO|nr:hypothetical protein EKO04_001316 [Ascochyta lentis]